MLGLYEGIELGTILGVEDGTKLGLLLGLELVSEYDLVGATVSLHAIEDVINITIVRNMMVSFLMQKLWHIWMKLGSLTFVKWSNERYQLFLSQTYVNQ